MKKVNFKAGGFFKFYFLLLFVGLLLISCSISTSSSFDDFDSGVDIKFEKISTVKNLGIKIETGTSDVKSIHGKEFEVTGLDVEIKLVSTDEIVYSINWLPSDGDKIYDVPITKFVEKAIEVDADIVAVSALLTTTMVRQRDVVEAIEDSGLDKVKVMVGGAPVTRDWMNEIGADGYSEDAIGAVTAAKELLNL